MSKARKKAQGDRKVHLFDDCPGKYYSSEEDVRLTTEVTQVTCGQCKGKVLNVIRDLDWSSLDQSTLASLIAASNIAKV